MIKKLTLGLLLTFTSLEASTFEESPAYEMASPLFIMTHTFLHNLPPVEVMFPANPSVFDAWYMSTLEENFHNLVTPLLNLEAIEFLNDGETIVSQDDIQPHLLHKRNELMKDCFKFAYMAAHKRKIDAMEEVNVMVPSQYAGALLVLQHYESPSVVSDGRQRDSEDLDAVVASVEATHFTDAFVDDASVITENE